MDILNKSNILFLRKITLVLFTFFVIIILASCDYSYYLFYNEDKDATSIELINYACLDSEEQIEAGEYNSSNVEILESLEGTDIDVFIAGLSEIGGISGKYKNIIHTPCGVGIKITYEDSSFTVIVVNESSKAIYMGEYNLESEIQFYFGIERQDMIDEFMNLIEEHFEN